MTKQCENDTQGRQAGTPTPRMISQAIWRAFEDYYAEGYRVSGGEPDKTDLMIIIDEVQKTLFPESEGEGRDVRGQDYFEHRATSES